MQNVKQSIDECNRKINDNPPINSDDPHAIRFSKLNTDMLNQIKQNMVNMINANNNKDDSIILIYLSFEPKNI